MGTAKRERQKANRQQRLEDLAKQARKQKTKRFSFRVVGLIVAVIAIVGGLYLISGGDDDEAAVPTSSTVPPRPEVVLPEGEVTELLVTTITEGTGELSKADDTLEVHYLGYTSIDGAEFDNSYDRGEPFVVTLGQGMVIDGWDQGLIGVQAGGRYQIDIPVDLAYGPDAAANNRPVGALTFIVDIMSITPGI